MKKTKRILSLVLGVLMVFGTIATTAVPAFASITYNEDAATDDYYNLISQRNWTLASGIEETEVVLNNDAGTRRQVVHTVSVDMNNEYTKVIPGYKAQADGTMIPQLGGYGTQSTSAQALAAEELGYGNVVAATNAMLSWYTSSYYKQHPEYIGEPLGYCICEGQYYQNSQGKLGEMSAGYAVLVVNFDYDNDGNPRPESIPKVQMRNMSDPVTGWEQTAISVWTYLVKPDANGVAKNQYSKDHGTGVASRTFVGITADGEIIISVVDGEQAPYSTGFTMYEMGEYMLSMGCIYAANCDGGGSTTFCTQRPGEDLKVNCSLSDGGERPTTNTILVISTAPEDGKFASASISSDYDYYTPGSSVEFSVLATDATGNTVDLPDDVTWSIKEEGMGTISNGVFTSNGTEGKVTVQMYYDGKVVGEKSITIATPDSLTFEQSVVTIPFGKTINIPAIASIGGGLYKIGVGSNDITYTIDNTALGTFVGNQFIAVSEEDAPDNLVGNVTATLNMGTNPSANVQFKLGKGSVVLWDFEDGQTDVDEWNVINNRTGTAWDYDLNLSLATAEDGQVHDGQYSMRLEVNGLHSKDSNSKQYAYIRLGVDGDAIELENAQSVGFWLYVPEDNIQCWVQGHYQYDSDGDGKYDTTATVNLMDSENVYYNIDESGWHYLSMDVSAYSKIALKYSQQFSTGNGSEKGEFWLAIVFHKAINNQLWQTNGTINGPYTYYLDSFTVDYSEAVDDREEPEIGKIYIDGTTALVKRSVVTVENNTLNLSASVADATTKLNADKEAVALTNITGLDEDSAKVYIDGVEVPCTLTNGVMSATVTVADGYHRVKFEICDNAGNKAVVIRVVKVEGGSDASTLRLVPADDTLDKIPFGSIYWMNLVANKIETIQSVDTILDLNSVNHWQLDHMILAEGFTATYTIDEETNSAHIIITRTGDNDQTGEVVLAQLPVRIVDFDNDMQIPGYTAATVWTSYEFWPQDMKMDVDYGAITFVDGYKSTALAAFSNEEFSVDTEMYTHHDGMVTSAEGLAYWQNHGSTHVHTVTALDDKAATCTEDGYTGRTYCYECNSVVDWGTTLPATGHSYIVSGNKLVCADCDKEAKTSGLIEIDGKYYYASNGNLISGWVTIDDEWYYFDKATYIGANGRVMTDNGISFNFTDGKLNHGEWVTTGSGKKYYYGPGYYCDSSPESSSSRPYVIDGKTYLFNHAGIMQTGLTKYYSGDEVIHHYYYCDENGVATEYSGLVGEYLYIEGIRVSSSYSLVECNGDIYYIGDGHKVVKNKTLYLSGAVATFNATHERQLKAGNLTFDENGKMLLNEGVIGDYLYIDGERVTTGYTLVEYDGDIYYISDGYKVAKNKTLYLSGAVATFNATHERQLKAGNLTFDENGKMLLNEGVIGDYLYIDGERVTTGYTLVEYDGDIYYIGDGRKVVKNTTLYLSGAVATFNATHERQLKAGNLTFDENGKLVVNEGVIGDYLYIGGEKVTTTYKLVEYNGDIYYISDGYKVVKNKTLYLNGAIVTYNETHGANFLPGYYTFDENGKLTLK